MTTSTLMKDIEEFIADTDESWKIPHSYHQLLADGKHWLLQSTSYRGRTDALIENYCRRTCNRKAASKTLTRALRGYSHGAYKDYSKETSVCFSIEVLLIGVKFNLGFEENFLATYKLLCHEFGGDYARETIIDAMLVILSIVQKALGIYTYEQGSMIDELLQYYENHKEAV